MTTEQFEQLLGALNRIACALEGGGTNKAEPLVAVDDPYRSPDVPAGYDTVLGYFSKTMPSAFELMDDPIMGTMRDGHWLTHQANRRGIKVVKVTAPQVLAEVGIETVNAYPEDLLRERIH